MKFDLDQFKPDDFWVQMAFMTPKPIWRKLTYNFSQEMLFLFRMTIIMKEGLYLK